MSLSLNAAEARKADNINSMIRETGKYVGTITRAEKLLSRNKVEGLGLSFKSDDGQTASYLDLYTVKPDGTRLRGFNLVQALLCCTRLKDVQEGEITFEKWNNDERRLVQTKAAGYPALMGKRIGFILQKELSTNNETGKDQERMNIFAIFEAQTGLVASEILDSKTKAERIVVLEKLIAGKPVNDRRDRKQSQAPAAPAAQEPMVGNHDFDDDIPF